MKTRQLLTTLALGLGLTLAVGLFAFIGRAAPENPIFHPPRNSHTAPLTTTVSITYDEPISAATVTSRTFAIHGMQSGLVTATHGVSGGRIIVTPTRPFHQGELVYVIATTGTLGLDGTEPLSSTQWQFRAGKVTSRCVAGFTDIDAGLTDVYYSSVAWGDYDNDGALDILLAGRDSGGTIISKVYQNTGSGFSEVYAGSLTGVANGSVAWGDYDSDGDLDILFAGSWPMSLVYRNDAGSFTDIDAGLIYVDRTSGAWGDYDNDGDLDILLTGDNGDSGRVSQVYRNDDGSFTDIGAELLGIYLGSVAWGDYDNDGDLDILLTGMSDGGRISQVYRNDAGSFTNIGAELKGVDSGSVAWGDYDNDDDLDILLTGANYGLFSRVYRNDGGSFTDIGAELTDVSSSSVAWGDYDNDGDLDILLTGYNWNSGPVSQVYRNDNGSFTDINAGLLDVYDGSVAWGDYDNDGDLDILLTGDISGDLTWEPVSRIYRNDDCVADFVDLAITKTVVPQMAAPGDTITYTLIFSSVGSATASGVVITDAVPVSVTVSSVVSSGVAITDTGASTSYVWQVQDLAPGEGGVITVTGRLSDSLLDGHTFTNTAVIAATTVDGDLGNNQADAAITVIAEADLEMSKEVNNSSPHESDTVVYTITARNNGPLDTSGVVVSDTLPGGVSYVSDDSGGDYDNTTGAWAVGNLDNGTSATLHVTTTVDAGTAGDTITNTAVIVASDQSDPVASNNQADAVITVFAEAGEDWRIYLPLVVRAYAS